MNLSRDGSPSKVQPAAETEGFLLKLVKKRVFGKSKSRRAASVASAAPSPSPQTQNEPPAEDAAAPAFSEDNQRMTTKAAEETNQKLTKKNQRKEPKLEDRLLSQERNIRDILGKFQKMEEDKREERNTSEEQLQLMVKMEEKVKDMEDERREEWTKAEERIQQMMSMTEKIMKMQEKIKTMEDERREERSRWEQRFQLSVQREEDFKHKEEERKQERSHMEQERRQERTQWQKEKLHLSKEKETLSQQLFTTEQKNGESMKHLEEGRREERGQWEEGRREERIQWEEERRQERSQWEQEKLLLIRGKEESSHKFLSAEQKNEDMKYEKKATESKFLKLKEDIKHLQEEKKKCDEERIQVIKERDDLSQKFLCSEQKNDFLRYEATSNQNHILKLEEKLTDAEEERREEKKAWEAERFQLVVEKEALTQKLLSAEQRMERARCEMKAMEDWVAKVQEEMKRAEDGRREEKEKREQERSLFVQEKESLTQKLLTTEQTHQHEKNQMKDQTRTMEIIIQRMQDEFKGIEEERRQERNLWEEGKRQERSQWEEVKRQERSQWEEERRQDRNQWEEGRRQERSLWEQETLLLIRGKEDMSHKFLSAEQKNEDMKYEMKTMENKFLKLKEDIKHLQEEKKKCEEERSQLLKEREHLNPEMKANEEKLLEMQQEMKDMQEGWMEEKRKWEEREHLNHEMKENEEKLLEMHQEMKDMQEGWMEEKSKWEEDKIQLLREKEALSHQMFLPIELTDEYVNMVTMNQMKSDESKILQMQETVKGLEDERAFEDERIHLITENQALSQKFISSGEENERARNETNANESKMLKMREQIKSIEEEKREEEKRWEEERIHLVAEKEALSHRFFSAEEHNKSMKNDMTTNENETLKLQEQIKYMEEEKKTLEEERIQLVTEKNENETLKLQEQIKYMEEEKKTLEEERIQLVTEKELLSHKLLSTEQQKEHMKDQMETNDNQMLKLQHTIKGLEEERREEKKKHWEEKLQLSRDVEALSQKFLSAEQKNRGSENGDEVKTTDSTIIENKWTNHFSSDLCELTLDPNTVHANLYLSNNNRKVTYVAEHQLYPDHKDRFYRWEQVLFREGLTQRYYWEVEWSGVVSIAVTYRGIGRGDTFGCNDTSWSLECFEGLHGNRYIVRHDQTDTIVPVCPSGSNRVGVCLDWPDGSLRFCRISSDTMTDLYTFQATFTEPLYPGFWCWALGSSVSLCQIEEVQ